MYKSEYYIRIFMSYKIITDLYSVTSKKYINIEAPLLILQKLNMKIPRLL